MNNLISLGIGTATAEAQHRTRDLSSSYHQSRQRGTGVGDCARSYGKTVHGGVKGAQTDDKSVDAKRKRSAAERQRHTELPQGKANKN